MRNYKTLAGETELQFHQDKATYFESLYNEEKRNRVHAENALYAKDEVLAKRNAEIKQLELDIQCIHEQKKALEIQLNAIKKPPA